MSYLHRVLLILSFTFFSFSIRTFAQRETSKDFESSLGIGLGLDYGGVGINFLGYSDNHLGAFLGLGYNFVGLGYNAGLKYRFNKENQKPHSTSFYALAMYGYNASIKITSNNIYTPNSTLFQKIYYGPTFGVGFDRRGSQYNKGYWSFAFLIPIRPTEYQNTLDNFTSQGADFSIKPLPFAISIGYKYFL